MGAKSEEVDQSFPHDPHATMPRVTGVPTGRSQKHPDLNLREGVRRIASATPDPATRYVSAYASGIRISRLPTWFEALTTPSSSICSTRRAALL